jgi:hypothetical protein
MKEHRPTTKKWFVVVSEISWEYMRVVGSKPSLAAGPLKKWLDSFVHV